MEDKSRREGRYKLKRWEAKRRRGGRQKEKKRRKIWEVGDGKQKEQERVEDEKQKN